MTDAMIISEADAPPRPETASSSLSRYQQFWERPTWLFYLLLPLFHFGTVKLTFLCAVTPENVAVVWLPNALLLAALLRFRGQRGWAMAALTFTSDVLANLAGFAWNQAVLLSMVNLFEVSVTYFLMRASAASPELRRLQDLRKLVMTGPLLGALVAGLLAAAVLKILLDTPTPYLTLTRLWWFGDALGLLIYTPMLLAFTQTYADMAPLRWRDALVMLATLALTGLIFSAQGGQIGGVSVTPTLLLPMVLYIAFRFGTRWTLLTVGLIALATAFLLTSGHQPFGNVPIHLEIVRAQEFILILCIVGIGFAVLLNELALRERSLEARVRERTGELEALNNKLATLSATDGLTGIANRRRFDQVLDSEWKRAARNRLPLTLIMLDLDLFKEYNDAYGHQAGDDCLRTVAGLLAGNVRRAGDLAARYGGEEFVLIAPMTDQDSALRMAETLCRALQELALPHRRSPVGVVTASIGVVALIPAKHAASDTLLELADAALYRAKQTGRNRVVMAGA